MTGTTFVSVRQRNGRATPALARVAFEWSFSHTTTRTEPLGPLQKSFDAKTVKKRKGVRVVISKVACRSVVNGSARKTFDPSNREKGSWERPVFYSRAYAAFLLPAGAFCRRPIRSRFSNKSASDAIRRGSIAHALRNVIT